MAKKSDTTAAIKAAGGPELDPAAYSQRELNQLQELVGKPDDFAALRKQFDDDGIQPDDNEVEYKEGDAVFLHGEDARYHATFVAYADVDGQPGARVTTNGGTIENVALLSQMSLDTSASPEGSASSESSVPSSGESQGDSSTPEEPVADETPTKKVRVNTASDKVSAGAAFIHPVSRTVIRNELVKVPDDEWTQDYLANRFLTEK